MDRGKLNRVSLTSTSFKTSKDSRLMFSPNRPSPSSMVRVSSSRFSTVSGRSNQSVQAVCKTPYHVVEKFGVALPVQVAEALTFADRSSAVSVHVTAEGWAWFVSGRRLIIWQCKKTLDQLKRPLGNSQCRELILPPSDLAHKGDLVSVYMSDKKQTPSCIAVSPEGTVRFWASISHESSYVEEFTDLLGQECDSLTNVGPIGFILATTTSTIVLLQIQVTSGRNSIQWRTIKTPQGWLGGIGKKMTSLIFGAALAHSQIIESKLVKVIAVGGDTFKTPEWRMYVLGERSLQKWLLAPNRSEPERLIYEIDINPIVRAAFHDTVWESSANDPSELEVWLLDMQPVDDGILILAAAVCTQISPQLHYAIGKVVTETVNIPAKFTTFMPLKTTAFYRQHDEALILGYRFVMFQQEAYMFNQKMVIIASTTQPGEEPDTVEFVTPGDALLGGGLCGNVPTFFSKNNGLVSVSPSDMHPNDFLNASVASFNDGGDDGTESMCTDLDDAMTILITDNDLEELALNRDNAARLKASFILYLKKQTAKSLSILNDLFPKGAISEMEVDTAFDSAVVSAGKDFINDIPAGDPRWAGMKAMSTGIGISLSLQIIHQLEDKHRTLNLYFSFLKEFQLWDRLTALTTRHSILPTTFILGELAEKIIAAIALRSLQTNHGSLIETAVKSVLEKSSEKMPPNLTAHDVFYRQVTQIHLAIQALVQRSNSTVHSDRSPREVAQVLAQVNTIILAVLQEVIQYRHQYADQFSPKTLLSPGVGEYIPWTAAPGKEGLMDCLMLQQSLTLKNGALTTGDVELQNQLNNQLVNLLDIILDARKCHLESIRGTDKFDVLYQTYETERHAIIKPLIAIKEYEQAAILAEKYCDFRILIEICEETEDKDRLDKYMERFSDHDFSKFVFNWYIAENKQGRLVEQFGRQTTNRAQQRDLSEFLVDHPSISWLQNVFMGEFKRASQTFGELAKDEMELLGRKKMMISLAKLALLASEEDESTDAGLEAFNDELDLVRHQEELPDAVLAAYGYDTERLKVLTPTELIKLFICDENQSANAFDFKKALDLLKYVDDERNELKHNIWCQAIKRDSWTEANTDSPINVVKKFVFFELVDLISFMGGNVLESLPPINSLLTAPELGDLVGSKTFEYLLRIGYEHVHNQVCDEDDDQ